MKSCRGETSRGEQRCEVVELNFSGSFGDGGKSNDCKGELVNRESAAFSEPTERSMGKQSEQDTLAAGN